MTKINADPNLKFLRQNDVLKYAIMAKISLMNQRGYSPFQIVFGSNLCRRDIENETLNPKQISNAMVKSHWHAMNESKKAYIEAENDVRLQKIEKCKQLNIDESIKRGTIVQYYRKGTKSEEGWKGPAKLIAVDGTVGLIRHGAKIIHAHLREVRKFRSQEKEQDTWEAKSAKSDKRLMTNDRVNESKTETHQSFVKLRDILENTRFPNGKLACQKCQKQNAKGAWKLNKQKATAQKNHKKKLFLSTICLIPIITNSLP